MVRPTGYIVENDPMNLSMKESLVSILREKYGYTADYGSCEMLKEANKKGDSYGIIAYTIDPLSYAESIDENLKSLGKTLVWIVGVYIVNSRRDANSTKLHIAYCV